MLKIGDKLPDLSLPNEKGEDTRLYDQIGKHPQLIYFYPKDETPGCTMEACTFRDYHNEFAEHGAIVYGISNDSVKSHERFKKKHSLNFSLLSDQNRKAEKAFGVKRNLFGLLPGRVTFLADKEGIIRFIFDSATQPKKHVLEALRFLKKNIPA